jgi:DNA-binding response OmpR family regulator
MLKETGITRYLTKPIGMEELGREVKIALTKRGHTCNP